MKLEKVTLNGFKSFADRTEFKFDSKITAIVGPNGCGKSNVVDAVKWVLGEQSAKSLRSGQMLDVIFSGSGSRKAAGMAEVSLNFSDVAGQQSDNQELEITRRLYKSGESEYLINGKAVRLKDIRETFMDTGIGTRAYSIIEQGQVDQLVTANKIDRRGLFEEAAGISKFKAHKKEALRKLERTEQNLIRLADIVNEVQKQLRSIKLQAGKARNYLEYSDRLKELRVNYSLAEYHQFKKTTDEKSRQLSELEKVFSEVVAQVGRNDALLSEMNSKLMDLENTISRTDNSLISIKTRIEQQNERIKLLTTRIEELKDRKAKASEQIQKISEQNKIFSEQISTKQKELQDSQSDYTTKQAEIEEINVQLQEISYARNSIEAQLDDEKSGILDIVRQTAKLHNEIGSLGSYRDNLSGQKDRLNVRVSAAQAELEKLLTEKAHHNQRLEQIAQILGDLHSSLENKKQKSEQLNFEIAQLSDDISNRKEKRSAVQSELNVLEQMEKRREGLNKTVKDILAAAAEDNTGKMSYVEGIVADIIQAQPQAATAVEAAMEGISDTIVINSTAKFIGDAEISRLANSRVKILAADRIDPFNDAIDLSRFENIQGRLVEFVSIVKPHFTELIWSILGKTVLVNTIEDGLELSSIMPSDFRFVTAQGELVERGKLLTIGQMAKAGGIISRKSRIAELKTEAEGINIEISDLTAQFEKDTQENTHLAKLCQDLRTSIYEANTEKTEANGKIFSIEQNIKRLTDEQPLIKNEIQMLQQQIESSVKKEYESNQKLEELEEIRKQRDEHIAALEAELLVKREEVDEFNSRLTELKVELGQIAEQRKSKTAEISSLQSQIQHNRMTLEAARTDLTTSDQQVEQAQRTILTSQSAISDLYMEKEQAANSVIALRQELEEVKVNQQQSEQELKAQRHKQQQTEQDMSQLKLELGQLQVKTEDLCQRVQEELSMNLAESYQGYQHGEVDWDAVRSEISDLRAKIERLGNVNVDAIEEQAQLEERNEFLTKQVDDLNQSKEQLSQLINKINRESKEKFRVTFEQIRVSFQTLFRKLFGGGKADVILEDPEDILECGIEIIARPPGKELRSISLLSGGEKTMTAIALLFSVFQAKPSPFCILDEVDAALDEANNERFNLIVSEFKESSQFVVVTHSKRTMSIADVLFGVTMQTQGVSKKISVKFDEYDTEDEPAAVA